MGSIVGGVVGGAIGGPVGAAIGSTIGAFADAFIASDLIGGDQVQRQTVGQVPNSSFSGADEGLPLRTGYGRIAHAADLFYRSARRTETSVERRSVGGKKGGGKGGQKVEVTTISYYMTLAYAVSDVLPINAVERIWLDSKLVYDFGVKDGRAEDIEIFDGSQTTASSTIVTMKARDGVTTPTPAYRGLAFVLFKELNLQDFGRPPSCFVQYRSDALASGLSRQTAIERLVGLTGSAALVDTSAVDGCVRGFLTAAESPVAASLVSLMRFWGLGVQVTGDGTIRFFHHADMPVVDVPRSDIVVVSDADGSTPGFPYSVSVRDRLTLPTRVTVTHLDPRLNYEQGAQSWRASPSPHPLGSSVPVGLQHQNDVAVQANTIAMTEAEATAYAQRLLFSAREEGRTVSLVLRPRYFWLRNGHKIRVPLFGAADDTVVLRVTRVAVRTDGGVEVEALTEAARVYSQPGGSDDDRDDPGESVYEPQDLVVDLLPVPALSNDSLDRVGAGFVLRRASPTVGTYRGGLILRAAASDGTYSVEASQASEGVVGVLRSALPAAAKVGVPDYATSLTVSFPGDAPISRTIDEVYAGLGWYLIGGEVVGVTSVEAAGGNRYTLSGLVRGLRGTEDRAAVQHDVGSLVVALVEGRFGAFEVAAADVGTVGYFKALAARGAIADADVEAEVIESRNARPFALSLRQAWRDGSGDVEVSAYLRSRRVYSGVWVTEPVALARDDPAEVRVEILGDATGAWEDVTASVTVSVGVEGLVVVSVPQSVRTAAGYSSSEAAPVRVTRLSAVTGAFDGVPLEVTV